MVPWQLTEKINKLNFIFTSETIKTKSKKNLNKMKTQLLNY